MTGAGVKARSAVVWNTAFNLFRDSLQFVTMLVLVRLLEREAYGEFGLVTSVMGFLAVFSANSFLAYLLQVREDSELHLQHHFTAAAAITVFVLVITNAVALVLWWVPTYAVVAPVLHVMSDQLPARVAVRIQAKDARAGLRLEAVATAAWPWPVRKFAAGPGHGIRWCGSLRAHRARNGRHPPVYLGSLGHPGLASRLVVVPRRLPPGAAIWDHADRQRTGGDRTPAGGGRRADSRCRLRGNRCLQPGSRAPADALPEVRHAVDVRDIPCPDETES